MNTAVAGSYSPVSIMAIPTECNWPVVDKGSNCRQAPSRQADKYAAIRRGSTLWSSKLSMIRALGPGSGTGAQSPRACTSASSVEAVPEGAVLCGTSAVEDASVAGASAVGDAAGAVTALVSTVGDGSTLGACGGTVSASRSASLLELLDSFLSARLSSESEPVQAVKTIATTSVRTRIQAICFELGPAIFAVCLRIQGLHTGPCSIECSTCPSLSYAFCTVLGISRHRC